MRKTRWLLAAICTATMAIPSATGSCGVKAAANQASDPKFGTPGYGGGPIAQAPCTNHTNPAGSPMISMGWPSPSNGSHGEFAGLEGGGIAFGWSSGNHNVLQLASWANYYHPSPSFLNPNFPRGIRSGDKSPYGSFTWNWGAFPCGYRPGLYYFADENNPQGGIVSTAITVEENWNNHFHQPKACSTLAEPNVYGGRYSAYANRSDCRVFEVNNFQTATHYDWVPATFYGEQARQGDLILFRWTNLHNVVQVHDVTQDKFVPGGITSGKKTECVGGPNYSCANGSPTLGEYMIDTTNHRPGVLHFSDEDILTDHATGQPCAGCTGMNQQFMLEYRRPEPPRSCCELPDAAGKYSTQCRVIEEYNDGPGAQFSYQIGAGRGDVVRLRWAGGLKIVQVEGGSTGPTNTPKKGGFAMSQSIECIPGPNMTCLNGTTDQAEVIWDINAALNAGKYDSDGSSKLWYLKGYGENKDGWTSSDTGMIIYVDESIPYNPSAPLCASSGASGGDTPETPQTPETPSAPAIPKPVVEFYHSGLDHYFMSSNPVEIEALDTGKHKGWARTGYSFQAYDMPAAGANPVCRFYMKPEAGDSHFYSASPQECQETAARFSNTWIKESSNVFYTPLPDTATGACPQNTSPVWRFFHEKRTNHRYTADIGTRNLLRNTSGWIAEGYGPEAVIMCTPL